MKKYIIIIFAAISVNAAGQTNQTLMDGVNCNSSKSDIQMLLNSIDRIDNWKGDYVLFGTGRMAVFQVIFYNANGIKVILNGQLWDDWDNALHRKLITIKGRKTVTVTGKPERSQHGNVVYRYADCEEISLYFKIESINN